MGVALLVAATLMLMTQLQPVPGGRRGARRPRRAAGVARRRQLRARRADDARHRPLRAVHDPGQPARHEPDRRVPDHDGLVRVPDAGRQPAVHPRRAATACAPRSAWRSAACPACCIAAYIVKSLPLDAVRWLVIVVVLYTAVTLIYAGSAAEQPEAEQP